MRRQCARRSKLRPRRGKRPGLDKAPDEGPQARDAQTAAPAWRLKAARGRGRYAGRRVRRQAAHSETAPQAGPKPGRGPERRRPGRRRGRPHSPHIVGAGPRRSTNAATERGLWPGQGPRSGPEGAWPCGGHGWPALRLAANLTGTRRRRGLGRHISRNGPQGRAGRAAAPPPHRAGRVAARRPQGRVGRGPPAGGTRTGAPFPTT